MSVIPGELVDAVREGKFVPFVGAGLSMSVGRGVFPSWGELIELLAKRADKANLPSGAAEVRRLLTKGDYEGAAQEALDCLKRDRFGSELEANFGKKWTTTRPLDLSVVCALWRLRPPLVVTTNYDRVLEWPWDVLEHRPRGLAPTPPRQVHSPDRAELTRITHAPQRDAPWIWHLHGSVERRDTVVLTNSQYEGLYPADAQDPDLPVERLRSLVVDRPLLFVGFSLDDEAIRRQIRRVLDLTGDNSPVSYLLGLEPRNPQEEAQARELLDEFQVQLIDFPSFGPSMAARLLEIHDRAFADERVGLEFGSLRQDLETQWRNLDDVLRGLVWTPPSVATAYRNAVSERATPLPQGGDGVTLLHASIELLSGRSPNPGAAHPLLGFLQGLLPEAPEERRAGIEQWIQEAGAALQSPAPDARARAEAAQPHVLVQLEEVLGSETSWRARAWFDRGEGWVNLFELEDVAPTNHETLVKALLSGMLTHGIKDSSTRLVFVMRRCLLCEPVEQWRPPFEGFPQPPLGTRHPVVVRSLDRSREWDLARQQLEKRWEAWLGHAADVRTLTDITEMVKGTVSAALVPPESVTDPGQLFQSLEDLGVTCLVLADAPTDRPSDVGRDPMSAALQAGVPVVLWSRGDPAATVESLTRVLDEAPGLDLPHRLREWRIQDADTAPVLLWEQADQLPPTETNDFNIDRD